MYLQYELTRFKLDFVQPSEQIKKAGGLSRFYGGRKAGIL